MGRRGERGRGERGRGEGEGRGGGERGRGEGRGEGGEKKEEEKRGRERGEKDKRGKAERSEQRGKKESTGRGDRDVTQEIPLNSFHSPDVLTAVQRGEIIRVFLQQERDKTHPTILAAVCSLHLRHT